MPFSLPVPARPLPMHQDHIPQRSFWKLAVHATKDLLHRQHTSTLPSPPSPVSGKALRKARSTPSLKHPDPDPDPDRHPHPHPHPPPLPSSSRRANRAPAAQPRPVISNPSLPYRIADNSKLSSPSLVDLHAFSSSSSSVNSENSAATCNAAASARSKVGVRRDLFAKRRRTKSASGLHPTMLKMHSTARNTPDPDIPPPAIYSPSFSTASSPSIQMPKTPTSHFHDPYASPRSITSVKRKPVPRHLYPEDSSPQHSLPQPPARPPPHTPLLSSTELLAKAINARAVQRDLTCLPIGAEVPASRRNPGSAGHKRSVSEFGVVRPLSSAWGVDDPIEFPACLTPPPPRYQPQLYPDTPMDASSPPRNRALSDDDARSSALSPLTDEEIVAIRTFLKRHTGGQRARQRRKQSRQQLAQSHSQSESEYEPTKRIRTATSCSRESYSANAEIFAAYLDQHDLSLAHVSDASLAALDSDTDVDPDIDTDGASRMSISSDVDVLAYRTNVTGCPTGTTQSRKTCQLLALEIDTSVAQHSHQATEICDGSETGDVEDESDMSQRDELETPVDGGSNRRTFGYNGPEYIELGVAIAGGVDVFEAQAVAASVVEDEDAKLPPWSDHRRQLPPTPLGVSDSSADEAHTPAYITSPLRIKRRSLSRLPRPVQSPTSRSTATHGLGLLTSIPSPNEDATFAASLLSCRSRAPAVTNGMGVPILGADELSQLESASEREAEAERGRRLRVGDIRRRGCSVKRIFQPRDSLLTILRRDDGDGSDSSAFSQLYPAPRHASSSPTARSFDQPEELEIENLSSSFDRLQMSLSKLKMHAPSVVGTSSDVDCSETDLALDSSHSTVRSTLKPALQLSPSSGRIVSRSPARSMEGKPSARAMVTPWTLPPRSEAVTINNQYCHQARTPSPHTLAASTSTIASTRSFMQLTPNDGKGQDSTSNAKGASSGRQTSRLPLRKLFGLKSTKRA